MESFPELVAAVFRVHCIERGFAPAIDATIAASVAASGDAN